MDDTNKPIPRQWLLWCGALLLAACGTAWLYAALPGINWPISTVAVAAGLMICCGAAQKKYRLDVVLPLLVACLLAIGAALSANPANDTVIAAAVLFALGSAVVSAHLDSRREDGPATWVMAAPYALVLAGGEAFARVTQTAGAVQQGRGVSVIRGVALAIPVTFVLARLLSEADPTFAAAREYAIQAFRDLSLLPRALFFLTLSYCLIGMFGIALRAVPAPTHGANSSTSAATRRVLGNTERLIVLGSVATLFLIFLVLQVSYLFGNPGGRAGSGLSYAQAVHRGFVELNVVSTICAVLLLCLRRLSGPTQPTRWSRVLEWLVTLQCQVLLMSAFYRVNLYEGAYGFTIPRLSVQVYAAVAFIALILLAIELVEQPRLDRFIRRVLVVSALAVIGMTWGNAGGWIAHANLLRYGRSGQIDVPYLALGLGPDAVPELVDALPHLPPTVATRLEVCLWNRYPSPVDGEASRWFEWSLRRSAFKRALSRMGSANTGVCQ
jgi:two-component system, OmpR family, sensor histidine kinase BaeS